MTEDEVHFIQGFYRHEQEVINNNKDNKNNNKDNKNNNKDTINVKLKPPVGGSKSLLISDLL